jgi:hypothetical protein
MPVLSAMRRIHLSLLIVIVGFQQGENPAILREMAAPVMVAVDHPVNIHCEQPSL